jgi:hypothetical protein
MGFASVEGFLQNTVVFAHSAGGMKFRVRTPKETKQINESP